MTRVLTVLGLALLVSVGLSGPAAGCPNGYVGEAPDDLPYDPSWYHSMAAGEPGGLGRGTEVPPDDDVCEETVGVGLGGNGSTAELFMMLEPLNPDYRDTWLASVKWIETQARLAPVGVEWEAILCDGKPGPTSVTNAWNAATLVRAYLRTGSPRYLQLAEAGLDWIQNEALPADLIYPGSNGYIWAEWPYIGTPHFFALGAEAGNVATGWYAAEIYRMVGSATAADIAQGMGRTMRDAVVPDPNAGHYWHTFGGGQFDITHESAFCAGQSGMVEYLLDMHDIFGSGGDVDYQALALGGLDNLTYYAVPEHGGLKWAKSLDPNQMGGDAYSIATGFGTPGVGRAFLKAYEMLGDPQHLDVAKKAGDWLLGEAMDMGNGQLAWSNSDDAIGLQWCVGMLGTVLYLARLGDVSGDAIYTNAAVAGANFMAAQQTDTPAGPIYPEAVGSPSQTDGWIWGVAGLANPLHDTARPLMNTPSYQEIVVNAANWMRNVSQPGPQGGIYWNYKLPLEGPITVPTSIPEVGAFANDEFDLRLWPNPARGHVQVEVELERALPAGTSVDVEVFDVSGRRIATPDAAAVTDSPLVRATWDARDLRGRDVPRGVYFLRVTAGDVSRSLKVALVR